MLSEYNYMSPTSEGCVHVSVPKRKVRNYFPTREIDWRTSTAVFVSKDEIIIEFLPSFVAKVCVALFSPLLYLLGDWKDITRELQRHFFPRKNGTFVREKIYKESAKYEMIWQDVHSKLSLEDWEKISRGGVDKEGK